MGGICDYEDMLVHACFWQAWIKDIEASQFAEGKKVTFPIIEDQSRQISQAYGMVRILVLIY